MIVAKEHLARDQSLYLLSLKLLTIEQVAELADCSIRHLHDEKNRGLLRCLKIGRRLRFRPDDVSDWMKRKTIAI